MPASRAAIQPAGTSQAAAPSPLLADAPSILQDAKEAFSSLGKSNIAAGGLAHLAIVQAEAGELSQVQDTILAARGAISERSTSYNTTDDILRSIAEAEAWAISRGAATKTASQIFRPDKKAVALYEVDVICALRSGDFALARDAALSRNGMYDSFALPRLVASQLIATTNWEGTKLVVDSMRDTLDKATALVTIATSEARNGDAEHARAAILDAKSVAGHLNFTPFESTTLDAVAIAQSETGDGKGALATLSEARSVIPRSDGARDDFSAYEAIVEYASAQAETGDKAGALVSLQEYASRVAGIPAGPQRQSCYYKIANVQIEAGDAEAAKRTLTDNNALSMSPYTITALARTLAKAGDTKGAVKAIEDIRMPSQKVTALRLVANIQAKAGDVGGAAQTFQLARLAVSTIPMAYVKAQADCDLVEAMVVAAHYGSQGTPHP